MPLITRNEADYPLPKFRCVANEKANEKANEANEKGRTGMAKGGARQDMCSCCSEQHQPDTLSLNNDPHSNCVRILLALFQPVLVK